MNGAFFIGLMLIIMSFRLRKQGHKREARAFMIGGAIMCLLTLLAYSRGYR